MKQEGFIPNRSLMVILPCLAGFVLAFSGCGSALQRAAAKGNTEKVSSLLNKKSKPSSKDLNRALIKASKNGRDGAVNALLDAGADINYMSGVYLTPLWQAANFQHTSTVKLLLSRGADTEATLQRLEGMLGFSDVIAAVNLIKRLSVKYSMISIPDTEENRGKVQKCQILDNPESSDSDAKQLLKCLGVIPGYSVNTTSDKSQFKTASACAGTETHFTVGKGPAAGGGRRQAELEARGMLGGGGGGGGLGGVLGGGGGGSASGGGSLGGVMGGGGDAAPTGESTSVQSIREYALQFCPLAVKYSMISIPDTEENRGKVQECLVLDNPESSESSAKQFLQCLESKISGHSKNTTSGKSQDASPGCSRTETHFSAGNDDYTVEFCPAQ